MTPPEHQGSGYASRALRQGEVILTTSAPIAAPCFAKSGLCHFMNGLAGGGVLPGGNHAATWQGYLARTDDALDQGRRRVATPDDRSLRAAVLTVPNIRLELAADAAAQPGRWAAPSRVKEGRPVKS